MSFYPAESDRLFSYQGRDLIGCTWGYSSIANKRASSDRKYVFRWTERRSFLPLSPFLLARDRYLPIPITFWEINCPWHPRDSFANKNNRDQNIAFFPLPAPDRAHLARVASLNRMLFLLARVIRVSRCYLKDFLTPSRSLMVSLNISKHLCSSAHFERKTRTGIGLFNASTRCALALK